MTVQCDPFPSHAEYRGNISCLSQAEQLLTICGAEFIAQHAPLMERDGDCWYFPSGFGVAKARPLIATLWPLMPPSAQQKFLVSQLMDGVIHLHNCLRAFDHAELPFQTEQRQESKKIVKDLTQLAYDYSGLYSCRTLTGGQ